MTNKSCLLCFMIMLLTLYISITYIKRRHTIESFSTVEFYEKDLMHDFDKIITNWHIQNREHICTCAKITLLNDYLKS